MIALATTASERPVHLEVIEDEAVYAVDAQAIALAAARALDELARIIFDLRDDEEARQ